VEKTKEKLGTSYQLVCMEMKEPYSNILRWKSRIKSGETLAGRPGPCKVGVLNVAQLHEDISRLSFGQERTVGTGALHAKHRGGISRRDFQTMVRTCRLELEQKKEALERRVEWLMPGSVWSMDDLEKACLRENKGHVNLVMDLASRKNLGVLGDDVLASGLRIALDLERKFKKYGAPLFMKVDGGGNYRSLELNKLFDEHLVIPLVSPSYYPPYNGSVEREHQEILRELETRIGIEKVCSRVFRLECEVSGHEVDHKRRQSLDGRTACEVFESRCQFMGQFGRRERKEAYEEIMRLAVDIVKELGEHDNKVIETAFRYAAETWMQQKQLIRVIRNGKVLPSFYRFWTH